MFQTSTQQFLRYHGQQADGLRLGQRFCNLFIRRSWPELFYQDDERKASLMIDKWLTDHHYQDHLPVPLAVTVHD